MELAQLMIFVSFISNSNVMFYIIFNICLKLLCIHAREFCTNTDANTINIILKYIEKSYYCSTSTLGDKKPIGLVIGKWYIAYVSTFSIQKRDSVSIGYNITFWSSNIEHDKSLSDNIINTEKQILTDNKIELFSTETWRHVGSYKGDIVDKLIITFYNKDCNQQMSVIRRIIEMVETSFVNGYGYRLIVMISGPSGTGKSHIASLLARELKGSLCDDFNPTNSGQNLTSLIKIINPSKNKPLVLQIDEWDETIKIIHTGIKQHEFFVTLVRNKETYNTFMDRLKDCDNVIVILTMNSKFNEINSLDSSYIRDGRIDLKVSFGGDNSYNPTDMSDNNFICIEPFPNIAKNISKERFTLKPNVISSIESIDEIKKNI